VLSFLRHQDKLGFIWTLPVPCVTHDIDVYDQMSQVDLIKIDFEICQLSYTYDTTRKLLGLATFNVTYHACIRHKLNTKLTD
jgi:hypothetical protein